MVQEGVVLSHVESQRGIEVNKAKIEVIKCLRPTTCVKRVRSFLGHVGFDLDFIKDFSKTAKPLTLLLAKDTPFIFSNECLEAFTGLKRLSLSPLLFNRLIGVFHLKLCVMLVIMQLGWFWGNEENNKPYVTNFASKTLNEPQQNYITTKKELLVVVLIIEKFWPYLLCSKVIIYIDHCRR